MKGLLTTPQHTLPQSYILLLINERIINYTPAPLPQSYISTTELHLALDEWKDDTLPQSYMKGLLTTPQHTLPQSYILLLMNERIINYTPAHTTTELHLALDEWKNY